MTAAGRPHDAIALGVLHLEGLLSAYVAQWHCVYCIQKGLLLNCCTSAGPSLPQKGSLLFRKMLPFQ